MLGLLRKEQFDTLEVYLTGYQSAFEDDVHKEHWPVFAFKSFAFADPALEAKFSRWLRAHPNSFAAHTARARYLRAMAFYFDAMAGSGSKEPGTDVRDAYLSRAKADFVAALKIRPSANVAHTNLLYIACTQNDPIPETRAMLDESLESCPKCIYPRSAFACALHHANRLQRLDQFVAEVEVSLSDPQQFRHFSSKLPTHDCSPTVASKDAVFALAACDRVLSASRHMHTLIRRGRIRARQGELELALRDFDEAVDINPQDEDALARRAMLHAQRGTFSSAVKDLSSATVLNPSDTQTLRASKVVRYQLDQAATEAFDRDNFRESAILFDLWLSVEPDDSWFLRRRSEAQAQVPDAVDEVRRRARASPDNFRVQRELDYLLAQHGRYPEILVVWDEYLKRNPDDGRAYHERGGAHFNMGHRRASFEDVLRACDLGERESCNMARRLGG